MFSYNLRMAQNSSFTMGLSQIEEVIFVYSFILRPFSSAQP